MTRGSESKFSSSVGEVISPFTNAARRAWKLGLTALGREVSIRTATSREQAMGVQLYDRINRIMSSEANMILIQSKQRPTGDNNGRSDERSSNQTTIIFREAALRDGTRPLVVISTSNAWEQVSSDGSERRYDEAVTRFHPDGITQQRSFSNFTNGTREGIIRGSAAIPADEEFLEGLQHAIGMIGPEIEVITDPTEISRRTRSDRGLRQLAYEPANINTDGGWREVLGVEGLFS